MAAWGNPDMRVLLAWLIVLGAFAGSATACAIWGSRKVAAHVRIETSCMLLDAAEKEGWISRSARFDLMQKVATSSKTSAAVRDAADRMRSGCPGRKVP
jgi:tripartite-type tricarboxylate transporter receptor subunit TctC